MMHVNPCLVVIWCLVLISISVSPSTAVFCGEPICAQRNSTTDCGTCTDYHCTRLVDGYCVRGLDAGQRCNVSSDCFNKFECINGTCGGDSSQKHPALGYAAIAIAVVCWGSNFVPVKKYDTGNGIYFQWVMCVGIWFVGALVQIYRGTPTIYFRAMIGGALWCTGNLLTVPIIRFIGLGLGLAIWGSANSVFGWLQGHFGLFGLDQEHASIPTLNLVGLAMNVVATIVFTTVKPVVTDEEPDDDDDPESMDLGLGGLGMGYGGEKRTLVQVADPIDEMMSPVLQRVAGVLLAAVAGTLYGVNQTPVLHLIDTYAEQTLTGSTVYSDDALDYAFSHYCGILGSSTFYVVVYCIVHKHTPRVFPEPRYMDILLPALISGMMWAVAQTASFVANDNLGITVAMPTLTAGPAIVGGVWGVVVFREIQGARNLSLFLFAFALVIGASTCLALSK
eukprot:PhM_4_TR17871/c0_g1_i1/m.11081